MTSAKPNKPAAPPTSPISNGPRLGRAPANGITQFNTTFKTEVSQFTIDTDNSSPANGLVLGAPVIRNDSVRFGKRQELCFLRVRCRHALPLARRGVAARPASREENASSIASTTADRATRSGSANPRWRKYEDPASWGSCSSCTHHVLNRRLSSSVTSRRRRVPCRTPARQEHGGVARCQWLSKTLVRAPPRCNLLLLHLHRPRGRRRHDSAHPHVGDHRAVGFVRVCDVRGQDAPRGCAAGPWPTISISHLSVAPLMTDEQYSFDAMTALTSTSLLVSFS